ncbi:thioredoxin family protein [Neorhodopirellula pilleata]|nr:thioredoxin family protein [Neorhodopirellula pilleata]
MRRSLFSAGKPRSGYLLTAGLLLGGLLLGGSALLGTAGCTPPNLGDRTTAEPAVAISPARFEEIVNQDKLVLVKFGATWCGPCRSVDQELKSLAGELPADVEVLKIDVDENPDLAQEFQITGIPRMLLVRSGEVVADETGFMSKAELQSWIGEHR